MMPFMRVLELYAVIMVISIISNCIYYNLKGRDLNSDSFFDAQCWQEHLE